MADFSKNWMWSEACDVLARADRLHREARFYRRGAKGFGALGPDFDDEAMETPVTTRSPSFNPSVTSV